MQVFGGPVLLWRKYLLCLIQSLGTLVFLDDYHAKKDRSPEFYGPSQPSWYSQGTASPSTVYSDNEQLYDTDTSRKPDY
ncbi:hypothetical protein MAR_006881 [Mya arenaria]|uniref:Uncharacterized protein n=1 Tax=Mya arenaria TaxID=6604 RepID=A0ABY7DCH2_MYAAR|nr:hypothetical protein MAR_006881 [Mya arenaria]